MIMRKMRELPGFPAAILCRAALLLALCAAAPAKAGAYEDFLFAVKFNDANTVQNFLRKGMDVNSTEGVRGESILMIALREKSMRVVDLLLKDADIKLDAAAANGDTAIMIAAYTGNLEALKKLIAAGAAVNRPGWTALHYAAANGRPEIISLLLEHAAYIDAESPNKTTPLMMAVSAGKIDAVKLLLDEGADIGLKNELGLTALDFARQFQHADIAEELASRMHLPK
ncbi:MAG: ankyrin repeat domain-containing protein [Burkholderiales bacterium]|nr:ankyrin repeat domain-containing protein [Burkholderiales bacterium]